MLNLGFHTTVRCKQPCSSHIDLSAVTGRSPLSTLPQPCTATSERARRDTASHAGSGLSATTAGVTAIDSIEYASLLAASIGAGSAGTPEGQTLLVAASPTPAAPVGQRCKGAGGARWGVALVPSYSFSLLSRSR